MTGEGGAVAPAAAALPDLVYPYKATDSLELAYSLRSVCVNAAGLFRDVWIVGDLPDWATGVRHLPAGDPGNRARDVRAKITAAVNHPDVADTVVILNDDFFLVEPIARWDTYHMGPTSEYVKKMRREGASRGWVDSMESTAKWMAERGHGDVLCRQGHRPLLWDTARLAEALAAYPKGRPLDILGLYDMAGAGGVGTRGPNSKVRYAPAEFHAKVGKLSIPWLSSNDKSFNEGMIGGYIRGMFRDPCRFEHA